MGHFSHCVVYDNIEDRDVNYELFMNNLFSFCIENPLKTWWKARKYFRLPSISINFFGNIIHNCPYANYNNAARILDIWSSDVMWKDKYDSPRHERDPFIWICFFRKFGFSINFKIWYYREDCTKQDGGMYYWEYILNYLYYTKSLIISDFWTYQSDVFKELVYENDSYKSRKVFVPTHLFSLNRRGYKKFRGLCAKTL